MAAANFSTGNPALDILYILLNGISEVPLISAPLAGLLILMGTLVASRKAAAIMFVSSLVGAGAAILLGAPYDLVTFGLFGYNSVLTGMALWSGPFTRSNRATLALSLFGAAVTSVTWMAIANFMGNLFAIGGGGYAIPGFTAAFVFTTWAIMYASKRYGTDIWPRPALQDRPVRLIEVHETASGTGTLLEGSENPVPEQIPGFAWNAWEFTKAVLNGVSQVTFVENWITGLFWVIGLTLSFELVATGGRVLTNAFTAGWDPASPLFLAGVMALIGSAIGAVFAIWAKFPLAEIRSGIHGYNQVLVMIALTSFLPLTAVTFLYAVLATIVCTLFTMPALQNFMGRWGIPALTAPFVFTTWIFILAAPYALNIPFGIGW
ncbi:MAG: urea transporter, partial [Methanomicrobiales archaeon]|nr:urea transporter [Methanomicrobiales archaeon]